MKTQTLVLFIAICLAGCASHHTAKPIVIGNVGKKMASVDLSWLTVESNRAAVVLVAYHVFIPNAASGPGIFTYYGEGLVVGPHTIICESYERSVSHFPNILQEITIQSFSNPITGLPSWSGVPAVVVARLEIGYGISLLITNDELPDLRPVVFGMISAKGMVNGYRLGNDDSVVWANVRKIVPVSVSFESDADGQWCDTVDQPDTGQSVGSFNFDMEHRLVCCGHKPAWVVEDFLRDNGVPVVTK